MGSNHSIVWTDEKVDELKRRWSEGESCSIIGKAMGVTRNAIIGKSHRLGLERRGIKVSQAELFRREQRRQARKARHAESQRKRRHQLREERPMRELPMQELPPPPPPFAGSLNLPFNDLRPFSDNEPNECRFIAGGGPDYFVCGTPTLDGESYCAHCKGFIYYRPIKLSEEVRAQRRAHALKVAVPSVDMRESVNMAEVI